LQCVLHLGQTKERKNNIMQSAAGVRVARRLIQTDKFARFCSLCALTGKTCGMDIFNLKLHLASLAAGATTTNLNLQSDRRRFCIRNGNGLFLQGDAILSDLDVERYKQAP
jgi:hypothetical protein